MSTDQTPAESMTVSMTSGGTQRSSIDDWIESVRRELADLPAVEVEEILDDVRAHAYEVASEESAGGEVSGGVNAGAATKSALTRLGSPSMYAADLRTAAGYPAVGPTTAKAPWGERLVSEPLHAVKEAIESYPGGSATLAFLTSLRPAWWIVRAVVPILVLGLGFGAGTVAMFMLFVLAIGASIAIGIRGVRSPVAKLVLAAANTAAALAVFVALVASLPAAFNGGGYSDEVYYGAPGYVVEGNVFAFGADGTMVANVRLFDALGNPVLVTINNECGYLREDTAGPFPVAPLPADSVDCWSEAYDSNGAPIARPQDMTVPNFVVPPLPGVPAPTEAVDVGPTPTAEANPTASPSTSSSAQPTPSATSGATPTN